MLKLSEKSAAFGLLPITHGGVTVSEVSPASLTAITPYQGKETVLSDALKTHHGMALPAANRATGRDGARAIWFGQGVMLVGPAPHSDLETHGSIVDQTDGWCVLRLSGDHIVDVLARVAPVDMRLSAFARGHVLRSQLGHMNVVYHRVSEDVIEIYGFRSMAKTMVHELERAMRSVSVVNL